MDPWIIEVLEIQAREFFDVGSLEKGTPVYRKIEIP